MRRYFGVVFLAAARHRRNESNWGSRIGIVLIEYERYRVAELKPLNAASLNHEGDRLTIERLRLASQFRESTFEFYVYVMSRVNVLSLNNNSKKLH